MNIPDWLFQELLENPREIQRRIYNPRTLREIAREKFEIDEKLLNKELAEKTINAYYFTDRSSQVGFNITLDNLYINHANSKLTAKPIYSEIETRYVNIILKKWLLFMLDY